MFQKFFYVEEKKSPLLLLDRNCFIRELEYYYPHYREDRMDLIDNAEINHYQKIKYISNKMIFYFYRVLNIIFEKKCDVLKLLYQREDDDDDDNKKNSHNSHKNRMEKYDHCHDKENSFLKEENDNHNYIHPK